MSRLVGWPLAAISLLLALQNSRALDLTPHPSVRQTEGGAIARLTFSDGADGVTYQPPTGWDATGGSTKVTLRPKEQPEAEFCIIIRPRGRESAPLAAQNPEELQALARAELPPGAEEISFLAVNEGSFTIGPQPCREVLCSFSLTGRKYLGSVSLLDRSAKERLVVLIHTRPADFEKVRSSAIASLFSWQQRPGS